MSIILARVNQHPLPHHHGWMDGWMVRGQDTIFHWVLVWTQLTFPVAEGSKSVFGVLKLGFIQLDGLKTRKWG
jgi:hypothetical protein